MVKYFVWTQGLRDPTPQVWSEKDMTQDGRPIQTLFKIELPVNDTRNLDQLAKEYPCEQI